MRQLTPPANLVLTILAAFGLLGTLGMPWFAAPAVDLNATDGPIERGAFQVGQFFATHAKSMVDGSVALGGAKTVLFGLVIVVVALVGAVSIAAVRKPAEDLLRLVALLSPMVVILVAVAHPGDSAPLHIHYGSLVALAASLLMASAAWQGCSMRAKQQARTATRMSA